MCGPIAAIETAPAPSRLGAGMEAGRLGRDPGAETGDLGMGTQRLDAGIAAGEFALAQPRMDRIVADLVQEHGRPPGTPFSFGTR